MVQSESLPQARPIDKRLPQAGGADAGHWAAPPPPRSRSLGAGIPVRLHFNDGACASGTAKTIGARGMFVETGTQPAREGCVDVRLHTRYGAESGQCSIRLPSMIMYRNRTGIGLLFRRLDVQARRAIEQLLGDDAA